MEDDVNQKRDFLSLVPRPARAIRVTRGGLEPSAIGEFSRQFSRQAWQVTSHRKSPRTTGNNAGIFWESERKWERKKGNAWSNLSMSLWGAADLNVRKTKLIYIYIWESTVIRPRKHKIRVYPKSRIERRLVSVLHKLKNHAFIISCTLFIILEVIRFVRHKSLGGLKDSIHKHERFTKQTSEHQT